MLVFSYEISTWIEMKQVHGVDMSSFFSVFVITMITATFTTS